MQNKLADDEWNNLRKLIRILNEKNSTRVGKRPSENSFLLSIYFSDFSVEPFGFLWDWTTESVNSIGKSLNEPTQVILFVKDGRTRHVCLPITHRKFIHFRDNHFRSLMNINYANYNVPSTARLLHRSQRREFLKFREDFCSNSITLVCVIYAVLPPTPSPATCKMIWLFFIAS